MKKVTGIGGIFFKCKDPEKIKEWYKTNLGFETDQWGTNFEWRQTDNPVEKGFTQWSPFPETTNYIKPSTKDFMINYRVENLENLVEELKKMELLFWMKLKFLNTANSFTFLILKEIKLNFGNQTTSNTIKLLTVVQNNEIKNDFRDSFKSFKSTCYKK